MGNIGRCAGRYVEPAQYIGPIGYPILLEAVGQKVVIENVKKSSTVIENDEFCMKINQFQST